jgi:hypothetical protein
VGSFPGWNNVIAEGGSRDAVHSEFVKRRKEGVGNALEEDFEFGADTGVLDDIIKYQNIKRHSQLLLVADC